MTSILLFFNIIRIGYRSTLVVLPLLTTRARHKIRTSRELRVSQFQHITHHQIPARIPQVNNKQRSTVACIFLHAVARQLIHIPTIPPSASSSFIRHCGPIQYAVSSDADADAVPFPFLPDAAARVVLGLVTVARKSVESCRGR